MTDTEFTKISGKKGLKSCRGRRQSVHPVMAPHAQVAEMVTNDELSWTVPAAEMAGDGLKVRRGEAPTANTARKWHRLYPDMQADRAADPQKWNYLATFLLSRA